MDLKEWFASSKGKKTTAIVVTALLLAGLLYFLLTMEEEEEVYVYNPTEELPGSYGLLVDRPTCNGSLAFISMLSTLAVRKDGTYNPLFILDEDGKLDMHQLDTIDRAGLSDLPYLLFTKDVESPPPAASQVTIHGIYDMEGRSLGRFKGYDDVLTVASHQEAIWAAPIAKYTNRVMVRGDPSFQTQEGAWREMISLKIPFEYILVVNPSDLNTTTLKSSPGYDDFDDQFHIPALSAVAAEVAAYRDAYVLTEYDTSTEPIGYMDLELNQRAIGYYLKLKNMSSAYGIPKNVALVGSASAVPQFQLPDETNSDPENVEGDQLVNCDVMYGFLGDDPYYMDSAVGRLVNLNVQGMSNQIVRTFLFQRFDPTVTAEYTRGTEEINWRSHGASFSGYEITYKRGQVTPARFWCRDADDEGLTYDYFGPTGLGRDILFGDGIEPAAPADINTALQASGFVAYRGHGSEYGSLYMIPYVINRNENGVLRGEEVRDFLMPPQVSFFVACMNSKIHGAGWWKPAEPVEVERTFALNYLYGGAVACGGATEVSFSNVMQDATSATEEWLPGIINNNWDDDNYEWDLNDAWFAFFWDALLNNEDRFGTIGDALRWAENRYINNPIHEEKVSPFLQDKENPDWQGGLLGAHWKEVTMFVIYGDPAFTPHPNNPGENSYRPWVNGPDDTGEP